MASNTPNIANFTQAQTIIDGNMLIVLNDLGTQIIDWANIPVPSLDENGGCTIQGVLTAQGINVSTVFTAALSTTTINVNGQTGITLPTDFYNQFTINNGIIVSAAEVIGESSEYLNLLSLINQASAYAANIGSPVYEAYFTGTNIGGSITGNTISTGTSSLLCTFTTLPEELAYTDFDTTDFIIGYTGSTILSTTPYISDLGLDNNQNLTAYLYLRQLAPTDMSGITVKVSKHYTI